MTESHFLLAVLLAAVPARAVDVPFGGLGEAPPRPALFDAGGLGAPTGAATPPLKVCSGAPAQGSFTALTYNTGLGPGLDVPYAQERIGPAAGAIASASWDVLCLDEVWTDAGRSAVESKLGLPSGQAAGADTRGHNEDPADRCQSGELDAGLACMRTKCAGVPEEDVENCAAERCQREGIGLYLNAPHCFNCVVASAGKSADEIKKTCEGTGASRLFGGRNGVLLASRLPLKNVETLELPSSYNNRVALFGTVEAAGAPVEVACTHLSAAVGALPPNNPQFSNWDREAVAQLDLVSAKLAARAKGGFQILMGDLNAGPKWTGDMKPDTPAVWNEIAALGFSSPAAEARPPLCSRCQGNLISPTNDRFLIDHVLVRGQGRLGAECAGEAFDGPVSVPLANGQAATTSLSDHYGVSVRFAAH